MVKLVWWPGHTARPQKHELQRIERGISAFTVQEKVLKGGCIFAAWGIAGLGLAILSVLITGAVEHGIGNQSVVG